MNCGVGNDFVIKPATCPAVGTCTTKWTTKSGQFSRRCMLTVGARLVYKMLMLKYHGFTKKQSGRNCGRAESCYAQRNKSPQGQIRAVCDTITCTYLALCSLSWCCLCSISISYVAWWLQSQLYLNLLDVWGSILQRAIATVVLASPCTTAVGTDRHPMRP